MGVIDLDARVKKLEQGGGGAEIDQIEADLTALENTVGAIGSYSTTEHEVGTWLNGDTIYEKTWDLTEAVEFTSASWKAVSEIGISANGISRLISGECQSNTIEAIRALNFSGNTADTLYIYNAAGVSVYIRYITLRYTKTTAPAEP